MNKVARRTSPTKNPSPDAPIPYVPTALAELVITRLEHPLPHRVTFALPTGPVRVFVEVAPGRALAFHDEFARITPEVIRVAMAAPENLRRGFLARVAVAVAAGVTEPLPDVLERTRADARDLASVVGTLPKSDPDRDFEPSAVADLLVALTAARCHAVSALEEPDHPSIDHARTLARIPERIAAAVALAVGAMGGEAA